jgi:ribonucleoside-diphosphate reductase beta chain
MVAEIAARLGSHRQRPPAARRQDGRQDGPATRIVLGMGAVRGELHLYDPQTLYRHWEESQWNPWEIDLSSDRAQWHEEADRSLLTFVLGSLMVAEERITTKFSGLVGAGGNAEEVTFLATQQVDEARHMQFYARFQEEIVSEPAAIAAHVQRAREQVSPAFQTIFDDKLVAAHDRLLANPGDLAAKVAFISIYHLILEATLGLTTFEFSTRFLERESLLPGFVAGYTRIHHDEQRHIGYGIWFLRAAVADHPELADVVRQTLRELLPAVAESLTPPEGAEASVLGASAEELRAFALDGLSRRLKLIGVPLESL